jgi:hypothetical protein
VGSRRLRLLGAQRNGEQARYEGEFQQERSDTHDL